MPPVVLSVQSHVAYGHAGNSAAVFPLQRLGIEAVPVHTVQFSNHTGYGAFRGQVFDAQHLQDIFVGLDERGILGRIDAVLSGYMGDASIGDAIVAIADRVRQCNPKARYLCDPVFGDVGRGIFVRPGIPEYHRTHTLPAADIITPNQFEFEQLMGGAPLQSIAHTLEVARAYINGSAKTVIITSVMTPDVPSGTLATLAITGEHAWTVYTPVIERQPLPNGMGDTFSAILLAKLLLGESLPHALAHATSSLFALVHATCDGSRDLPLVAAQAEIVAPSRHFDVMVID